MMKPQKRILYSMISKTPEEGVLPGFSMPLQVAYTYKLLLFLLVDPLTDIVTDYACQNGTKKGYYHIQ